MKEFFVVLTFVGVILVMMFSALAGATYYAEDTACKNLHALTGVQTNVSLGLGCMVKYKGEWVAREVMTNHKQEVEVK